jgi:hypothetical protein
VGGLAGKTTWFRVALDTPADWQDGWVFYGCRCEDEDVTVSVWLPDDDSDDPDEILVKGQLRIIHHPADRQFPAVTEYRITCRER